MKIIRIYVCKQNYTAYMFPQVFHLPGHSPGSIGIFDRSNGIMATEDSLYQTDGELIDWYPGSSVGAMKESVEKIASMAESVDVVLPGHNDCLEGGSAQVLAQCSRHLKMCQPLWRRQAAKAISRARARTLLAGRAVLPGLWREWMQR